MKLKQKRTVLVKDYVTEENKDALQSACAAKGKSISDVLNECTIVIIRDHHDTRPKRNDTPPFSGGARNHGKTGPTFARHRTRATACFPACGCGFNGMEEAIE